MRCRRWNRRRRCRCSGRWDGWWYIRRGNWWDTSIGNRKVVKNNTGTERGSASSVRLYKRDVVRHEDLTRCTVITAIRFGVKGVSNQHTFHRTVVNLRVMVRLNKDKSPTANLTKMREIRFMVEPAFIRSMTCLRRDGSAVREIAGG
jgi:hypothetical protein